MVAVATTLWQQNTSLISPHVVKRKVLLLLSIKLYTYCSVLFELSYWGFFCPHIAATPPVGSPGSAGVTVESTNSESNAEVAITPPEEQTTRYVG